MHSSRWVLQLCHSYGAPFDDVARQWACLFDDTEYKILTVFLTGKPDERVTQQVGGDAVVYLGYRSKDLKGLKRKQIRDIESLHVQYKFEFVVAHRYKPIFIAAHLRTLKVYGVLHAYGVFESYWRRRFVERRSDKITLLGVSNAIRDDIKLSLSKFPSERIQTFYNRVNVETLQSGLANRAEARGYLNIPQDAYVVANVGRLHPDKDQETLLIAFAKASESLTNAILVIVGEGRLKASLESKARELNIIEKVVFTGRVEGVWRFFKAFDVFALTSNYEPFGMVLLEAMVAEVPVVATNVGGAPEVLGDCGHLVGLGDTEMLAKLLMSDVKTFNRELGLQRVTEKFSDSAAKREFTRLIESDAE
ncbi:MAG: glycosyl transferase [Cellvibrionaceae bacterium]|nr:glycosyl transferase [Cellvibrionaceae bacterium]MAZ89110.1 glycosyl transferase [Cellvibrionaceae bacterium]|tara:strand:+ start:10080 stop:11171 length:1092 start_codon:yes stop_codon:yes gene_type:complete